MLETYRQLACLLDTMTTLARDGEWDRVTSMQARCAGIAGTLMSGDGSGPVDDSERGERAELIRTLLRLDADLREMIDSRKREIAAELRNCTNTRRLVSSYGDGA